MNLGWTELLLVAAIALLLFGPKKLPSLGRSLGEAIRGFKKSLTEDEPMEEAKPVPPAQQIVQNPETPLNAATEKSPEKQEDPKS